MTLSDRSSLPSPHNPEEVQVQAEKSSPLESFGKSMARFYALLITSLYDIGKYLPTWTVISTMLDVSILLVKICAAMCCCGLADAILWNGARLSDLEDFKFAKSMNPHQDVNELKLERLKADRGTGRVDLAQLWMDVRHVIRAILIGCLLCIIKVFGQMILRYTRIFSTKLKHASLGPWLAVTEFLWPELDIKIRKETRVSEEISD